MKHKPEITDLFLHMLQTLKLSLNASQNGFKAGSIFQILKNPNLGSSDFEELILMFFTWFSVLGIPSSVAFKDTETT